MGVLCFFQLGDKVEFLCQCSFLEIYNEQIFDLLDPTSTGLQLREDIKRGVFVDGLLEKPVSSARDVYNVS
jgi:kinesin family protein 15